VHAELIDVQVMLDSDMRCPSHTMCTGLAPISRILWVALALALPVDVSAKDTECSDSPTVSKEACLSKSSLCMWLALEDSNLCMPCEWSGVHVPCPPNGAIFGNKQVYQCDMKCPHQEVITKVSACTDVSGTIGKEDCFAKGSSASTRCMWTSFRTKDGEDKSMCGPCEVGGYGIVPTYAAGNVGPEAGSTVLAAASQCDVGATPCKANCPPLGRPAQSQLVSMKDLGVPTDGNLPEYFAVTVPPPYGLNEYTKAANVAAAAAGWPEGSALPPLAPVMAFGRAPNGGPPPPSGLKVLIGPPPPGIADISYDGSGAAPSVFGQVAAPSFSSVAALQTGSAASTDASQRSKPVGLRISRHRVPAN